MCSVFRGKQRAWHMCRFPDWNFHSYTYFEVFLPSTRLSSCLLYTITHTHAQIPTYNIDKRLQCRKPTNWYTDVHTKTRQHRKHIRVYYLASKKFESQLGPDFHDSLATQLASLWNFITHASLNAQQSSVTLCVDRLNYITSCTRMLRHAAFNYNTRCVLCHTSSHTHSHTHTICVYPYVHACTYVEVFIYGKGVHNCSITAQATHVSHIHVYTYIRVCKCVYIIWVDSYNILW